MDIAASIQSVTEEIILKISENVQKQFKIDNLCLAGGVALNCVANGKILKKIFKNMGTASCRYWRFFRCCTGTMVR